MCLAPALLVGCYAYAPLTTAPAPGARLSLEINDLGRVGLAEHAGDGIARIDGWLVSADDSEYTLRVEQTVNLGGGTVPWSGERTTVKRSWVSVAREKAFSKSRTILAAGAVTAGIIGFFATRGFGTGFGSPDTNNGSNNGQ